MSEENGTPVRLSRRLATKTVIVEEDGGGEKEYTVRELSAAARATYRNFVAAKINKDGRITDTRDIEEELVARCLFDPDGQPVKIAQVRELPSSMCAALYEICSDMNALSAKGEDDAKKA